MHQPDTHPLSADRLNINYQFKLPVKNISRVQTHWEYSLAIAHWFIFLAKY